MRSMKFYIDGAWTDPAVSRPLDVVNPATEEVAGRISLGSAEDVDRAAKAARRAFPIYSQWDAKARVELLRRIVDAYEARAEDLAQAITLEMGSPITFSRQTQVPMASQPFKVMMDILPEYRMESRLASALIRREPIGVCGLITPWNWPVQQVTVKLASALAAGCTVVLKPSELAPLSPVILAEILHEAGVPPGVFNLVNGDGPTVGDAIARHPDIDMISFTGSTRAGISVAKAAADTVKRVTQELGGKSANVILPDADLASAVRNGVLRCFTNAGQSCQAPTRMLVHRDQRDTVFEIARTVAAGMRVGSPLDEETTMGPLVSKAQFDKVQGFIRSGMDEGARLVAGGTGRPGGLNRGYYVLPTVFGDVTANMRLAREEIFGPVLSILAYDSDEDAISLSNDTIYGLSAYVSSGDPRRARRIADRLQAGRVYVNGAAASMAVPFGGYKQSGNGRELGIFGMEEFFEVKALVGVDS